MSIHPSLRGVDTLMGQRSVFTRIERVQKLMKDGKLAEESSVFGLPKVRTRLKIAKKKVEAAPAAAAAAVAGAAVTPLPEAPAAAAGKPAASGKAAKGAKPAKPAKPAKG